MRLGRAAERVLAAPPRSPAGNIRRLLAPKEASAGGSLNRLRTESEIFQFGVFRFNSEMLELTRNGLRIPLQLQPARLLGLLLSSAGELVKREAIQESLWRDGTTVDFEVGVNRYVRQLRIALRDDAASPALYQNHPPAWLLLHRPHRPESPRPPPRAVEKPEPDSSDSSIVVLPFANLSGNPEDEYFSDGLAEEITCTLAQIDGLRVIARTSAFAFKGRNEDIREIAKILRVHYVLEGSVRRSAARIRVTVQLIHGPDGSHRMAKRYDREMTDIFALQDEISADIAAQLKVSLAPRQSTVNFPAFESYLEGRFHWRKYSPAEFEKAIKCFERAVAADPGYAQAYTGIAQSRISLVTEAGVPALEMLPAAAAAARRALDLDPRDAEAHAALGQTAAMLDYDWPAAEKHFKRALALDAVPYVRLAYAIWYLLPHGRMAEAIAETDRVVREDPLHLDRPLGAGDCADVFRRSGGSQGSVPARAGNGCNLSPGHTVSFLCCRASGTVRRGRGLGGAPGCVVGQLLRNALRSGAGPRGGRQ